MKRKIFTASAFALIFCFGVNAFAEENTEFFGKKYMALREICAELGFNVEWNGEEKSVTVALNEDESIKFTTGYGYASLSYIDDGIREDDYAFLELEGVPVIDDGIMYIPAEELEFLKLYAGSGTDENIISQCTVKEIGEEGILVEDSEIGEVVIIVNNTEITDGEGNPVSGDEISVGDKLNIVYGEAMTKSIPPINSPVKIVIEGNEGDEVPLGECVVKEISDNGILVEDSKIGEVVIVVNDDTKITDGEGNSVNSDEISVGDELEVIYGEAMTMSIPPINNPISIVSK